MQNARQSIAGFQSTSIESIDLPAHKVCSNLFLACFSPVEFLELGELQFCRRPPLATTPSPAGVATGHESKHACLRDLCSSRSAYSFPERPRFYVVSPSDGVQLKGSRDAVMLQEQVENLDYLYFAEGDLSDLFDGLPCFDSWLGI